ncbi:homoserine O-acetyltransferase/O-succinyltransferase family protein [Flexivirga alba]|uniref:Homoserine O-succinyltransferase n=1 Tax=Flexivirga alba TaxID=702742 RepID=A0ABW2AG00_9MICO
MTTLTALAPTSERRVPSSHEDASFHQDPSSPAPPATRPLQVAFVNNMPDAAFCTTERQFCRLLQCTGTDILMRPYVLPSIPRKPVLSNYIQEHYSNLDELWDSAPDALIVTGANPHTSMLSEERYWRDLCGVLSWG